MTTSSKVPSKTSAKLKTPVSATAKLTPKANIKPATKSVNKPAIPVKPAAKKMLTITPAAKTVAKLAAKTPAAKPIKTKKIKLVRDSFTIPKPEYLILDNLKLRAADLKHPVKKSELLRAGIKALAAMPDAQLLLALKAVPMLKTGRPSN